MSKTINFDYVGGTYTQSIAIRGTNLPWRYECDADWLQIEDGPTSLTITVPPTYDFHNRQADIILYDRFDNELRMFVEQKGYYNLGIECSKSVVLYHSYYDMNEKFDSYVTVYGGPTQNIICKDLDGHIVKVWDNSDMYNDYIIRIPENLSGEFVIEHSDAQEFIKYCIENNIPYNDGKLIRKMTIVQVSTEDVIGEMVVSIKGNAYRSGDICEVTIDENEWLDINIESTKYIHVDSPTKYSVIDDCMVDCQRMAYWVDYTASTGLVRVKANERNMLDDRYSMLRLVNRTNAHQFIDIKLKQESEA